MTTEAQVRRLMRPILERNPDLILRGRCIIVPPITSFLRFCVIERSIMKGVFGPMLSIRHTYRYPVQWEDIGFPWRLSIGKGTDVYFEWNLQRDVDIAVHVVENIALPMMRRWTAFRDFENIMRHGVPYVPISLTSWPNPPLVCALAGDIEVAVRSRDEYVRRVSANFPDMFKSPPTAPGDIWEETAYAYIRQGRSGDLVEHCHEASRKFCEINGLLDYYVRDPFPIELEPWLPGPPPGFVPREVRAGR